MGEMPFAEEVPNFTLTYLAMVQGLSERIYNGQMRALDLEYSNKNIETTKISRPIQDKEMYFPSRINGGVEKLKMPALFKSLGELAIDVLARYGHSDHDIQKIVNPVLRKAGVVYNGDNNFAYVEPDPHPAELMRRIAYEHQPGVMQGEKLTKSTLEAVLKPFIYKPQNPVSKISPDLTKCVAC
tara:strand:- start:151 stop:702 length:552 start_codon:yes stop_codon:yes gene_type:complete